jgi:hypothetical protein
LLLVCARSISRTTLSESRRCHPDHRFSRRPDRQSYRNLIKTCGVGQGYRLCRLYILLALTVSLSNSYCVHPSRCDPSKGLQPSENGMASCRQ